jgi:4-carboxymuconolactone decarboxylase
MSRVPDLRIDHLSAENRALHDRIVSVRSGVARGPYAIWLRTPALADAANQLGNALRLNGRLDKRVFELVVLTVARHWCADYVWSAHAEAARGAGLSGEVITALRERRVPAFAQSDEAVAYETTVELCETRDLTQATYQRAIDAFGLDTVIELITAAGYYTIAAMMVKAFEIPVPEQQGAEEKVGG